MITMHGNKMYADLKGEDGNAMCLIGATIAHLNRSGLPRKANLFREEAYACQSYQEILELIQDHGIDIIDSGDLMEAHYNENRRKMNSPTYSTDIEIGVGDPGDIEIEVGDPGDPAPVQAGNAGQANQLEFDWK